MNALAAVLVFILGAATVFAGAGRFVLIGQLLKLGTCADMRRAVGSGCESTGIEAGECGTSEEGLGRFCHNDVSSNCVGRRTHRDAIKRQLESEHPPRSLFPDFVAAAIFGLATTRQAKLFQHRAPPFSTAQSRQCRASRCNCRQG